MAQRPHGAAARARMNRARATIHGALRDEVRHSRQRARGWGEVCQLPPNRPRLPVNGAP